LRRQYLDQGLINDKTTIRYGLAAGKIEEEIEEHFSRNGWVLFTPQDIRETLSSLSEKSWEDNVVTMTAKLLLRDE
jgi:glycerol kinase